MFNAFVLFLLFSGDSEIYVVCLIISLTKARETENVSQIEWKKKKSKTIYS